VEITITLPQPHPKQRELLNNRKRFNVLKCGRRFGKTELCQELILETWEQGGIAGYWSPTYKNLHEVWNETKFNYKDAIRSHNETVKQIVFANGAKVDFWSMDDPDSGRGRKYHRAIIDECEMAGKFQEAWEQTIRPTLTDYKGDAYLLSTPQFGDTYFKQICKNELEFPDWKTFIYTTYDNPYIDPAEIELARSQSHPMVFACEYLAEDIDGKTLNPFAHQWDDAYHLGEVAFQRDKQLFISVDFNVEPFCATYWHYWLDRDGHHIHGIDESEISNGSVPAMIDEIKLKYGHALHSAILTGDSMGGQKNIARRDNASHYMELQAGLRLGKHQLMVLHDPSHSNSRTDTNTVLWRAKHPEYRIEFKLNKEHMKGTVRDFRNVQCDAFNEIVKRSRKDLTQRADFLDASRYLINLLVSGKNIINRQV